MKKQIALLLFIFIGLSCSTNSDSNGNSTTTVVPIAPTSLSGTAVSTSQINLSWTHNSTNETGFKIERRTGTGNYAIVGTVNADFLTFNNTGLTPSTTYIYRVYSYNSAGNSVYSDEISVTTLNLSVSDVDGNEYQTVNIGSQRWTQTNLNVSRYRNGDVIPQVTDPTQWATLTTGAWCYYNNDPANGAVYGKLYNWYAVNDPRGLAPIGYHIPLNSEWTILSDFLGGPNVAGGKMKESGLNHWQTPNTGATNESNFNGLPGGYIYSPVFVNILNAGFWWSSTEGINTNNSYCRTLNSSQSTLGQSQPPKYLGASLRCIKD